MKTKGGTTDRKHAGQPSGSRPVSKPLKGRRIFLHLQGYRGAARLEQDLILLGGSVEKCFSRDVNCVVTNRGAPADYEKRKQPVSLSSPSPVTPSPFNMAMGGVDSPQSHSPGSLDVQKPLTRGKAMAQAAKSTKKYGTMDVIESARTWKIKIIHVDIALRWIQKEIEKIPAAVRNNTKEDPAKRQMKVRRLRGSYMKFEASNRGYRPLYQELKGMPEVHFDSPPWTCPFSKGKQGSRIDERGEGEEERDGGPDELLALDEASPGARKDQPERDHKADLEEQMFGSPIMTAGELRTIAQEKKRAEMKRGYCEVCQVKYDNIDKHVYNNRHREFVLNNDNYTVLDRMIASGPNMVQFVEDVLLLHRINTEVINDTSEDKVLLLKESPSSTSSPNKRNNRTPKKSMTKRVDSVQSPQKTKSEKVIAGTLKTPSRQSTRKNSLIHTESPGKSKSRTPTKSAIKSTPTTSAASQQKATTNSTLSPVKPSETLPRRMTRARQGQPNEHQQPEVEDNVSSSGHSTRTTRTRGTVELSESAKHRAQTVSKEEIPPKDEASSKRKSSTKPKPSVSSQEEHTERQDSEEATTLTSSLPDQKGSPPNKSKIGSEDEILESTNSPLSVKLKSSDLTPKTKLTLERILKKEGVPVVCCRRLSLKEVNLSAEMVTPIRSPSSMTAPSISSANTDSQTESEMGPIRKVRSSSRSAQRSQRSRSRSQSLSVDSQSTTVQTDHETELSHRSDSIAQAEGKENMRKTRSRVSTGVSQETHNESTSRSRTDRSKAKGILTPKKTTKSCSGSQSSGSKRKVKLKEKWTLATERSMREMLNSVSETEFDGFLDDSKDIPKETSYEDVSEVEVDDDSDVEWVFSGETLSPVKGAAAVDCPRSSPAPTSTGATPIKHILQDVSQVSEPSSTGWDDHLDEFLDGQMKMKTADLKVFTSLIAQAGSPRRSPRKTPNIQKNSPFEFAASPVSKIKTPKKKPASPLRQSPRKHTPKIANRTLDFSSPNFSLLDSLGEAEDLWVGPTQNTHSSKSYTQKAADRSLRCATPGQRTPVYQQAKPVFQSTPVSNRPTLLKQKGFGLLKLSAKKIGSTPTGQVMVNSPKTPSTPRIKSTPQNQPTTPKIKHIVDDEVEFNLSSPGKHGDIQPQETPIDKKDKLNRIVLSKSSDSTTVTPKRCFPDIYDLDEPDEFAMPQKKLLKSLSCNKKQVSLGHMPSFEFKSGTSLKDKSPAVGSPGLSSNVRLSNLGRSVTPLIDRDSATQRVNVRPKTPQRTTSLSVAKEKKSPLRESSKSPTSMRPNAKSSQPIGTRAVSRSPAPSVSGTRKEAVNSTPRGQRVMSAQTTPQSHHSGKTDIEKTPSVSSTTSTPKTVNLGRQLDKLLSLHSLEDIQFGPRRKSSNMSSVVRFHYDDYDSSDSEGSQCANNSHQSTPTTTSRKVLISSVSAKSGAQTPSGTRTRRSSSVPKRSPASGSGKMTSPKTSSKPVDWSKPKSPKDRSQVSRLPHMKWTKSKRVDWSNSRNRTRSKSVVTYRKRPLRSEESKLSRSVESAKNLKVSRSCSPRKRLRMDMSPRDTGRLPRKSHRLSGNSVGSNFGQRNKTRSVKKNINYKESNTEEVY